MTAKEYLNNLRKLKRRLNNKKRQCENIRENIEFLRGIDYSKDKVQTSAKDSMSETMATLLDLEHEVEDEIQRYTDQYNETVNRINGMSRKEYIDILTMRYLEDDYRKRKFEYIACEIDYSYDRTCHMHGEALQEFERKYLS